MAEKITIITPQFERTETLDFEPPKTEAEFYHIIENAPTDILLGFGFRKWSSMNEVIAENQRTPIRRNVTFAAIDLTGSGQDTVTLPIGRKEDWPMELLEIDEDILLFPAEWYDIIPNGFIGTSLNGEAKIFEHGVTDDDRRFGCIAFGIRKPQPEKGTP